MKFKSSKVMSILLPVLLTVIFAGILYFVYLPAINIHSIDFWISLVIIIVFAMGMFVLFIRGNKNVIKIPLIMIIAIVAVVIVGSVIGLQIFNATRYASVLDVKDYDFTQDLSESLSTSSIALMDTDSARMLGDREIGSLSEVVSQYEVSEEYVQIDFNGNPKKVSPLMYAGIIKWFNNRDRGIPGYVTVDPVTMSADYTELEEGMKYVPSAYLFDNLERHIRFACPTKIFGNTHFEIDEEGNPYFVSAVYKYTIGLFDGKTVGGAIITDPISGEVTYYDLEEIPRWVDMVFDGELLCEQYNWYGQLSNGYFNQMFAKKGCKVITDTSSANPNSTAVDFGYISKDGDIWIYTGVTSINSDSSNIGFVLINERTGEAHYYSISGADEASAMAAAQGEVQEKGYRASFPSLINVDGMPTYIMVLKDASGLVKLFAAVNVEQYNNVVTATSQTECFEKYRKLMGTADTTIDDTVDTDVENEETTKVETTQMTFEVVKMQYVDVEGNTFVYFTDSDGNIYKARFSDNEKLILTNVGDTITVNCAWESGVYRRYNK